MSVYQFHSDIVKLQRRDCANRVTKGPVTQAQTQGLRMDREQIYFHAIAGFEWFKTLLRVEIVVQLHGLTCF